MEFTNTTGQLIDDAVTLLEFKIPKSDYLIDLGQLFLKFKANVIPKQQQSTSTKAKRHVINRGKHGGNPASADNNVAMAKPAGNSISTPKLTVRETAKVAIATPAPTTRAQNAPKQSKRSIRCYTMQSVWIRNV